MKLQIISQAASADGSHPPFTSPIALDVNSALHRRVELVRGREIRPARGARVARRSQ